MARSAYLPALALLLASAVRPAPALTPPDASRAGEPQSSEPQAGAPGGPPLALFAAKALTCSRGGPAVVAPALLLVRDGRIEAIDSPRDIDAEYVRVDLEALWLAPGMVDLHSHVGGSTRDINDMVHQVNPGLRVTPTVVPGNSELQACLAAGVTTVLYIPGSGTNIGGQGVLLKTARETFESVLVRDPGSLKIAQGDNPTRWGYGMGRLLMNWHLRNTIRRGMVYASAWEAYEDGEGPEPERNLGLDVFRELKAKRTQVSTHTQYYQLVMITIKMLAVDFELDVYIDHGSFDSYENADRAIAANVAAILGPRTVMWPRPPVFDTDGQVQGTAWGFQKEGLVEIGFNTDAPVIPPESLPLQSAMSQRYGFSGADARGVLGLTSVPACAAGIDGELGSLEVGKSADIIVVDGDPADPRTRVWRVLIGGRTVYEAPERGGVW
jgi:imidazolonepropionase-like amidohydrolase